MIAEHHVCSDLSHIRRIGLFSYHIAIALGFDESVAHTVGAAARLHDIGMVSVPASILQKPNKLTTDEMAVVKRHVEAGLRLIGRKREPLIQAARIIIGGHHERWDGSGYPNGLKQEAIPQEARIVAIADTFDAICTPRAYRRQTPPETAISVIANAEAAGIFDPATVKAFHACRGNILDICRSLPHR